MIAHKKTKHRIKVAQMFKVTLEFIEDEVEHEKYITTQCADFFAMHPKGFYMLKPTRRRGYVNDDFVRNLLSIVVSRYGISKPRFINPNYKHVNRSVRAKKIFHNKRTIALRILNNKSLLHEW